MLVMLLHYEIQRISFNCLLSTLILSLFLFRFSGLGPNVGRLNQITYMIRDRAAPVLLHELENLAARVWSFFACRFCLTVCNSAALYITVSVGTVLQP